MAPVSGAVTLEEHGLSAKHPLAVAVVVSAVGDVAYLALAVSRHERDVAVVPSAGADVACQEPPAVGAPLKPLVAVRVAVHVLAVHELAHVVALHVDSAETRAVLEEGHTLAVGTVGGLETGVLRLDELLLLDRGGIGEEVLLLVLQRALVDLPQAAALGGVGDAAPVGREADGTLLLGCVGDLLGGLVVDTCHIDVAVHHEGHLLAVGRHGDLRGARVA